jgi:ADP-ribose pyrophosphatase YjhB (NUDIX family)
VFEHDLFRKPVILPGSSPGQDFSGSCPSSRGSAVAEGRTYPSRPYLAVSAAIIRDGRVLIVRRARPPAYDVFTLPGGGVEAGETLREAVIREVLEETALTIEPLGLAGYREAIARDADDRVERHFVILPFAARWLAGEVALNEELAEARWLVPSELDGLKTTEGLAEVVRAAYAIADGAGA